MVKVSRRAGGQCHRTRCGRTCCRSSFRPTAEQHNRHAPIWASRSICSWAPTRPSPAGPTPMPTTMQAMSTGWRRAHLNRPPASAPAAAGPVREMHCLGAWGALSRLGCLDPARRERGRRVSPQRSSAAGRPPSRAAGRSARRSRAPGRRPDHRQVGQAAARASSSGHAAQIGVCPGCGHRRPHHGAHRASQQRPPAGLRVVGERGQTVDRQQIGPAGQADQRAVLRDHRRLTDALPGGGCQAASTVMSSDGQRATAASPSATCRSTKRGSDGDGLPVRA